MIRRHSFYLQLPIALFCAGVSLLAQEQGVALSLAEAERYALSRNTALHIQENQTRIAELNRSIADAAAWPKLGAVLQYSWMQPPPGAKRELLPGVELDLTSGHEVASYGVQLRQTLYAGGRIEAAQEIARLGEELSHRLQADAAGATRLQVRTLFLQTLLLEGIESLAEQNAARAEQRRLDAEKRLAAGVIPRLELLRLSAEAADASVARNERSDRTRAARAALRLALDWPEESGPALSGDLVSYADRPADLQYLRDQSGHSERLRAAQLQVQMAEANVTATRGQMLPTISAAAGADLHRPHLGQSRYDTGYSVSMQLTMPLFEHGRIQNEISRAEVEAENARLQLQNAERELDNLRTRTVDAIASLQASLPARRQNVERAQAVRDATDVARRSGAASERDLSDAELALLATRTDQLRAISEWLIAMAQWEQLTALQSGIFESSAPPSPASAQESSQP
ncbi:MAG: TolC family protein [Leptospirales bacterium]|nr:TolC family protein [Leptospirales bacterium]